MPPLQKKCEGFTLIELSVVIAILGLFYVMVIPRIENITGLELKSEARKVAGIVRYAYDSAVSKNKRVRLMFGFSEERDSIWIEEWQERDPKSPLMGKTSSEDEERMTITEREELEKAPLGEFVKAQGDFSVLKLKDYVKIKGVWLGRYARTIGREEAESERKKTDEPSETASILFLPQGLTDDAVIYLSDGKGRDYSVGVNPVTGKPTVFNYYVDPKDL